MFFDWTYLKETCQQTGCLYGNDLLQSALSALPRRTPYSCMTKPGPTSYAGQGQARTLS